MTSFLLRNGLVLAIVFGRAAADIYLNNPRGSNNKLSEQSNNAQNQQRLFDSQNNAAAGYQIGDNCKPACQNGNRDYDASKAGAMQGIMTYYQGSEVYIEWFMQHGCGAGHPNLRCQVVLQYMTEADNPGLRDGTKRGNDNTAGGEQEPPTPEEAADITLGQHEPLDFYLACKARDRNKGLFTADQNMNNDRGATATRQNNNGNGNANDRNGLECPEERDYYPYWHPSPWHDIVIFTDDPTGKCDFYRQESQNVKAKNYCSLPEFNNAKACQANGGSWQEVAAFDEPEPECLGGIGSRDNHNGNVRNGHPMYHVWEIPDYVRGRTVLRIRYNITTNDFDFGSRANPVEEGVELSEAKTDAFFMDARFNDLNPGNRRRRTFTGRTASDPQVLPTNPVGDFLKIGNPISNEDGTISSDRLLRLQVNTAQFGRTFEDRTHGFLVKPRPSDVPDGARIVNYNVRGRRGNIVQTYPSVEYDFVPSDLVVEEGTYLHFQWVGSDANNKNNAGNGRQGTDRSNLVQVAATGENMPLPITKHTLFFDAEADPDDAAGNALVDRFTYLDQDATLAAAGTACNPQENNNDAIENCKQLNGASAYFDGGLVEMKQVGEHHVISTRNNAFTNRSQKSTIKVTRRFLLKDLPALFAFLGALLVIGLSTYVGVAIWALKHPTSAVFGKAWRPRILRYIVSKETLERRIEERKAHKREERRKWAEHAALALGGQDVEDGAALSGDMAQPPNKPSWAARALQCCHVWGVGDQKLVVVVYGAFNALLYAIGFFANLSSGFQGSIGFPIAKGAGYMLDMNFAILVLPTLKSLQTAMRHVSATREWIPIDDPIAFHILVAGFVLVGGLVHVGGHAVHMTAISSAPPLQHDHLQVWALSWDEEVSGTPLWQQLLDLRVRCAPLTGVFITFLMAAMYITAMPCVRRGTNSISKRLGGYNLFWRLHLSWKWVYVLLLLHAPLRLWIWLFFPAIFVAVDKLLLARRTTMHAALTKVHVLPRDVIGLTFKLPAGFAYQAGQYVLLGWRGEWHPFTLTSAPEERCLSVHIRAPATLDWCSALRRHLTVEAPQAAGADGKVKDGDVIRYTSHLHQGRVPYCRPAGRHAQEKPEEHGSNDTVGDGAAATLPADGVALQLAGPFGAPAQKVWSFETIMVVGAGIGVTPFASILRSAQIRAGQREAILSAAVKPSRWRSVVKPLNATKEHSPETVGGVEGMEKLVEEVITVPKRIYFYWIVRSQEEFDWFYDLLAAATAGPTRDVVDVSVFMTGEIELSQVRKLPCAGGQFFGRPNWARIFRQNREKHKGEHLGVFLCGSPVIGAELAKQSKKNTDPPACPGGTRFSFFKEHF